MFLSTVLVLIKLSFRPADKVVTLRINGTEVTTTVTAVSKSTVTDENRFGVSLAHANAFVTAYKNRRINGYKVCNKYPISGKSASVHAETFLWNVLNSKVSVRRMIKS